MAPVVGVISRFGWRVQVGRKCGCVHRFGMNRKSGNRLFEKDHAGEKPRVAIDAL
jgi:hypothetical protein